MAGIEPDEVAAVGATAGVQLAGRPLGSEEDPVDLFVQSADDAYMDSVAYGFDLLPAGVDQPKDVWRQLKEEPGTVVVSAVFVPTRTDFSMGGPPVPFQFEGFYLQDEALPEDVYITVTAPGSDEEVELHVIGVLDQLAIYSGQVVLSQETLESVLEQPVVAQSYWLRLEDPSRSEDVAKALEKHFLSNGVQATDLAEEIDQFAGANIMINRLLQGFMSLGLIVGIAALGVIAARSVVERRQQIGVLRAIGFQRRMVLVAFMLESSFIALLGIGLGVGLGMALSPQIVGEMADEFEGLELTVPWAQIVITAGVAYVAALLTTYLPARQASRVYPAEALRYE